jgi:hypothetical protein
MKIALPFLVVLLAAFSRTAGGAESPDRVENFSKLRAGDKMVVTYHSDNGSYFAAYELTFYHKPELALSIVQSRAGAFKGELPNAASNRVDLGTLTLSRADLAGLDRLVEFYHSERSAMCSRVDTILFRVWREGKVIAAEQVIDRSCEAYKVKGIITFSDLIERLLLAKR